MDRPYALQVAQYFDYPLEPLQSFAAQMVWGGGPQVKRQRSWLCMGEVMVLVVSAYHEWGTRMLHCPPTPRCHTSAL